jgi:malonyl-CoA O-methyltransferase
MNAPEYDKAAILEQEVGHRLFERLDFIKINPSLLVDLGGGTGIFTPALQEKYPTATVLNLDISENMLQLAKTSSSFCADIMTMPLKNHSVDVVFSNCVFQNCLDINTLFSEIKRVLKPEGLLLFSSFGPDTLKELQASLKKVNPLYTPLALVDMHDIGDMLIQYDFSDPVMDAENIEMHYSRFTDLIEDLQTTGTHNATMPLDLIAAQAIKNDYERYRRPQGELPATFEIIYGLAWNGSHATMQNCSADTHKIIPIKVL